MAAKIASTADLKAIVDHAKHSPAELERLASNPEDVLTDRGLVASPGAVAFLRSMGTISYDEGTDKPVPGRNPGGASMGEN